jgi:hypothetical protein
MKENDRVRVMDMMFTTLKDVQSIFSLTGEEKGNISIQVTA